MKAPLPFGRILYVLLILTLGCLLPQASAQLFEDRSPLDGTGARFDRSHIFPVQTVRDQDPEISDMIAQINSDSVRSVIRGLQDFGTRFLMLDSRKEVAEWLADRFTSYGYTDVKIDSFLCYVNWGGIYVDTNIQYNVIASLTGASAPGEEYVIGGHYDSFSYPDPYQAAPGANDNGSAVAATMEIARIMKLNGYQPEATIRFILFAAEELGLFGSRYQAETARTNGTDIRFMYNMDMISNNPDNLEEVTIYRYTGFDWAAYLAADLMERYTSLDVYLPEGINTGSDSYPYWLWGFPSMYVEERDFSPHWHQLSDTLGNCNIEYCTEITRGACALLMEEQSLPYPRDVYALSSPEGVTIHWASTQNANVAGYNIYRSETSGAGFEKINSSPVNQNEFADEDVPAGVDYYYLVTTVNEEMEESLPSPEVNGARFAFSETLLVINSLTNNETTPDSIFQFYDAILQGIPYEWFDLNLLQPITLGRMSSHRHILWLGNTADYSLNLRPSYSDMANFFLNGGNMLVSAFNPCRLLENVTTYPMYYPPGSLMHEVFKVDSVKRVANSMMFQAYPDEEGYDTLRVDSEKYTHPNFPGQIYNIDVLIPSTEGSVIYRFDSYYSPGTPMGAQQDKPIGLEYMGEDFKTILLSFPLYYIDTADAAEFIHFVMENKFNMIIGVPENEDEASDRSLTVYPNPFLGSARFTFSVIKPDLVELSIYDLQGRKVTTIISEQLPSGEATYDWNADGLARGIYIARMQMGKKIIIKKLAVL